MRESTLEIGHAETLLDVVFGVIIALPLIELPKLVTIGFDTPSAENVGTVVLATAALVFCVFYWLEVRHFLAEQQQFDEAIRRASGGFDAGVPLPLGTFVLGSLFMMTLAIGILSFATIASFRAFLATNILFWMSDLAGTTQLKRLYKPYQLTIDAVRKDEPGTHGWFVGHIKTPYFYFYGTGNTWPGAPCCMSAIARTGTWVNSRQRLVRSMPLPGMCMVGSRRRLRGSTRPPRAIHHRCLSLNLTRFSKDPEASDPRCLLRVPAVRHS